MKCAVESCFREVAKRQWCEPHYRRMILRGSLDEAVPIGRLHDGPPILERLTANTTIDPQTNDWIYTGAKPEASGHVRLRISGQRVLIHRWSYEHHIGPIPAGYHVDHVWSRGCRSKACWNPAHLEAVSPQAHCDRPDSRQALARAQTHCINGHPYDTANTYIDPRGKRGCRACRREQGRQHAR